MRLKDLWFLVPVLLGAILILFPESGKADYLMTENEENFSRKIESDVLDMLNEDRKKRGKQDLEMYEPLRKAASKKSWHMEVRNYFGHVDHSGRGPSHRYTKFDKCRTVGENLARIALENTAYVGEAIKQNKSEYIARETHEGFMNSPPHRDNLLDKRWDYVGVGVYFRTHNGYLYVYTTEAFCT